MVEGVTADVQIKMLQTSELSYYSGMSSGHEAFILHWKNFDLRVVLSFIHVLLCSPGQELYFLEVCLVLQQMFCGTELEALPLLAEEIIGVWIKELIFLFFFLCVYLFSINVSW